MNWKNTAIAAMVAASLVLSASAVPVSAEQAGAVAAQSPVPTEVLKLTGAVRAGVKSAFSERTPTGVVFGVVIVLSSDAVKVTRVPDYELRMTTEDGTVYTLVPSMSNPGSLQPKEMAELAYSLNIDGAGPLEAATLDWIEIDDYVYPRKEKTLLSLNIEGMVWESVGPDFGGAAALVGWGDSFRLDEGSADIRFTPTAIEKRVTERGHAYVVTVKAVNTGREKRYVPEFAIGGTDGLTMYEGVGADSGPLSLNAGEARNLHFVVHTPEDIQLDELVVTIPERFVTAPPQSLQGAPQSDIYQVGRLRMELPSDGEFAVKPDEYGYGTPIGFDPLYERIGEDVRVSLMEFHLHDNQGDGYQTAIAKFRLQNVGKLPVPLPRFGAEAVSPDGYTYAGIRQQTAADRLMPGLSHIISYAINVPKTETAERYALRLLDEAAAAPYAATIAAINAEVMKEREKDVWNLYPFNVRLNGWTVQAYTDAVPVISYSYKMILDLDIERTEDVVVDANFSRLKIELADSQGRVLGSESIPFAGPGRLISGKQTILFDRIRTEQHQYPLTINIYETIDTPGGEANRLIRTLRQKN